MEKNTDREELRKLEEAAWAAYIRHWHEVMPRKDFKEIMESSGIFEMAKKTFEDAGGSWEELKVRKEKESFEKK